MAARSPRTWSMPRSVQAEPQWRIAPGPMPSALWSTRASSRQADKDDHDDDYG